MKELLLMTGMRISGKHFIWAVASRGGLSDQRSQTGCPRNGVLCSLSNGRLSAPTSRTSQDLTWAAPGTGAGLWVERRPHSVGKAKALNTEKKKKGLLRATGLAQTSTHHPLSPTPQLRSLHTGNSGWTVKQHRADPAQTLPHVLPLKVKDVLRRFTCLSQCWLLHVTLGECCVKTHFHKTSASHGLCPSTWKRGSLRVIYLWLRFLEGYSQYVA